MSEILLVNPRRRRKARVTAKRRTRRASPKAAHRIRRGNPLRASSVMRRVRRKVRAVKTHRSPRRRRNPIGLSLRSNSLMSLFKGALIGGAGSVLIDAGMGQLRPLLPASLTSGYAYQGVKALATVSFGILGRKLLGATAVKMAEGALTVQAASLIRSFIPATMPMGGLGWTRRPGVGALPVQSNMIGRRPNAQIPSPQVLRGLPVSTAGAGSMMRRNVGIGIRR